MTLVEIKIVKRDDDVRSMLRDKSVDLRKVLTAGYYGPGGIKPESRQ